jgi:hypothetical protein
MLYISFFHKRITLSSFWHYFGVAALILSSLTFAMLLLSEHSYWLMRTFFAIAVPVSTPLILLSLIFIAATYLLFLAKKLRWKTIIRNITLWILVFIFSCFSFSGAFLAKYEITASANFYDHQYYLIKFNSIDSYRYHLYSCDSFSLFCSRSSGYIGIPYQHETIHLRYNLETRKVYIQNVDRAIQIPNRQRF